jgi:uracil-DNA glycosylase family 4
MPERPAGRSGRRVTAVPPALAEVERRMVELAAATCPPGFGPVLGEGDPTSPLALVGEAPGEREVAEGYPFAGPAGRLLDDILAELGAHRMQMWLTNVVKCRPVRRDGERLTNRPPSAAELAAWLPLLTAELEAIHPRCLVCLGATSARVLLGRGFRLTEQRGQWLPGPLGTRALATFHPAYVLHLEPHDPAASRAARETVKSDLALALTCLSQAGTP